LTPRPKHPKPDANQADIIAGLETLGFVVWNTSPLGGQVLDLVVFGRGMALPVEVKQPGLEGDLTDAERESIERLRAVGVDAVVATCAEDVVEKFNTETP